jgi:hypothetical protein
MLFVTQGENNSPTESQYVYQGIVQKEMSETKQRGIY